MTLSKPRAEVLAIFDAVLRAVHGTAVVSACLRRKQVRGPLRVIAIGKAACAMWEGAHDVLGDEIEAALIVTKHGHVTPLCARARGTTVIEAGHPLPDEWSLRAGEALLDFIATAPPAMPLLFLVSGGASSLVEVLPDGVSLADLRQANEWLLASGWPIDRMNAVRRRISRIKGGRLAAHVRGRRVLQLLISDVAGDVTADIGSGLLVSMGEPVFPLSELPVSLRASLAHAPPLMEAAAFANIETRIVARLDDALAATVAAAGRLGYRVHLHRERLEGDAETQGRSLAAALLTGPTGVHVWGGETTVCLPERPGRGGRNQQLALAAAGVLTGHERVCLLAAGSDGSDGPGGDAGALVDGGTLARGALDGLDAEDHLRRADAGRFLEASGDLIQTGPTGTNVTDVVIGLTFAEAGHAP